LSCNHISSGLQGWGGPFLLCGEPITEAYGF
jgi:hypothetical protein